jgi:4-hydroxy-tetrahydrodipicolinate reductase
MKLKVCIAGATGWVGSVLTKAILQSEDLHLVEVVGKTSAGKRLGDVLSIKNCDLIIKRTVKEALSTPWDVFIDYTHPTIVKANVEEVIRNGRCVVIGTSGLTEDDFSEINESACRQNVGVFATGNYAITAALLQKFAMIAAKYIPQWEIIDYASAEKPDAPSGTTRELAAKLSQIRTPFIQFPVERTHGQRESRGSNVKGTQIHSIRLPGYVFSFEIIFGQSNERLTIHQEAGRDAEPYVMGTLLAVRKVKSFPGLRRGLDTLMDL